ncbi:phosphotransferase family protein [Vallicoccus soli]|nr:phosphotransferase [Vallicoccus soli]
MQRVPSARGGEGSWSRRARGQGPAPAASLEPSPQGWSSVPEPPAGSRSASSTAGGLCAILLPRLHKDQARVRAFLLDEDEVPLTLAAERPRPPRPPRLRPGRWRRPAAATRDGERARSLLVDALALRTPALRARGTAGSCAWLLEESLPGRHVSEAEAATVAGLVAQELVEAWGTLAHALREAPPPSRSRSRSARAEFDALLRLPHVDPSVRRMGRQVDALVRTAGSVVVGPCHGDPVLGNVLRCDTGGLALIDWELAGFRPLAADLAKLALTYPRSDDALALLEREAARVCGARWRGQVAAVLVHWLSRWRATAAVHQRSGRAVHQQRSLRRRLALLQALAR